MRGNQTTPPTLVTYLLVVLRESIRIVFLVVALNYLCVLIFDIDNACIMAPIADNLYILLGREFSKDFGGNKHHCLSNIHAQVKKRRILQVLCGNPNEFGLLIMSYRWRKAATKPNGDKY